MTKWISVSERLPKTCTRVLVQMKITKDDKTNYICPWYRGILPKLFGKKIHKNLEGTEMIGYFYRGVIYVTKFEKKK